MDYRNADGSIAEMCGNGLRVFVRYLLDEGLIAGDRVRVATRAGEHQAQIERDGQITVTMGQAQVTDAPTTVTVDRQQFTATKIDMPNPHAVVWLEDFDQLDRLNLFVPPVVDQDVFPSGANVEFVVAEQKNRSRMRVWERGVGETMSCGTGAVAVAVDALNRAGLEVGTWRVDVPGGIVRVHRKEGGHLFLTGPAVIVARGDILVPEHCSHHLMGKTRIRDIESEIRNSGQTRSNRDGHTCGRRAIRPCARGRTA
jgi:diaminopimelate epimerase